jgi:hypothetical protein
MLSPSRSFTYAGNTIYCGLHMTLECRTTKLRSLSQCLSPGKESQQEKVHDKSTCGMTPRECASRIKEYKTLRTKDYKTKSRNQQHGNRIPIKKWKSMFACLEIGSAYKSSIQRYNIVPYSFLSFLFFLPPESLVTSSLDCFFF